MAAGLGECKDREVRQGRFVPNAFLWPLVSLHASNIDDVEEGISHLGDLMMVSEPITLSFFPFDCNQPLRPDSCLCTRMPWNAESEKSCLHQLMNTGLEIERKGSKGLAGDDLDQLSRWGSPI
jgi:hypothetical protein